ncbi:MAG: hypothetical protein M0P69_21355 [Bacteroidales bacterium]|nr:hypothetical protein [Bacteroidales bacterium]
MIKYFRLSWGEILWSRSWVNIQMLICSIPELDDDKKKRSEHDLGESLWI